LLNRVFVFGVDDVTGAELFRQLEFIVVYVDGDYL